VNNINKWNQVQEELAHDTASPSASLVIFFWLICDDWEYSILIITPLYWQTILPKISGTSIPTSGSASETSPPPEIEFQFSDINGLTCLLCARQFKTLDQLKLHNLKSDLHKVCDTLKPLAFLMT